MTHKMLSSDEVLEQAARDGSIDIAEWPRVLESVLQKLHDIVYNDFPIPRVPLPAPLSSSIDPEVVASTPPGLPRTDTLDDSLPDASESQSTQPLLPTSNSQSSQKENDAPLAAAHTHQPASRLDNSSNSSQAQAQPSDAIEAPAGTLPPDLLSLYTNSTRILERNFARSPPYTIQRLAELVLQPKKHYRFLPSFLRALDRAVSVSSPASDFPLPVFQASPYGGFLPHGNLIQVNGDIDNNNLGSDESLGGALLTPISWLRNQQQQSPQEGEFHSQSTETIEGPNGAGRIETVTVTVNGVPSASSAAHTSPSITPSIYHQLEDLDDASLREQGAVTQGELLRQEQELGVVPVAHSQPRRQHLVSGAIAVGRDLQSELAAGHSSPESQTLSHQASLPPYLADPLDEGDHSHARGPDEIGMEDIGSQSSFHSQIDIDSAVGRQRSPPVTSPPPQYHQQEQQQQAHLTPQPPSSATPTQPPRPAPQADAEAAMANEDDSGAPGQDPKDVELQVDKLKDELDQEKKEEAADETAEQSKQEKDRDGDVVVADADGKVV